MFLPVIDKRKPGSIFRQILNQIIQKIESGAFSEGYQLPPSREMARMLEVNRSTVVKVYEELWAMGYVDSTPGSYTHVRKRVPLASKPLFVPKDLDDSPHILPEIILPEPATSDPSAHLSIPQATGCIDLQRLEPDASLIDRRQFSRCLREAMADAQLFGYCDVRGFAPLRIEILRHMSLHSIHAADKNILITNGSQNALQLIFQSLVSKDDTVVIESPTYSMLIPLLQFLECKVVEVPLDKDGMDMQALRKTFRKERVRLVYCMPSFHNPTGVTMSQEKREELLQLCEQHQSLIVEDGFEEEMKFLGKVHLPVKSMDRKGMVIYLGSFSKIFAPGLRTGWIIAHPAIIQRLTALKTTMDLSSNTMSQVVMYRFCQSGAYELHIRKMMRVFRKRMKTAFKSLKTYIPREKASWQEPLGGFLVWLKIHSNIKHPDLEVHLAKNGVNVSGGNAFFFTPSKKSYIRISISASTEPEIEEGIKRIGRALSEIS
jgi:DNA-binding transcriptional MocR family regulator